MINELSQRDIEIFQKLIGYSIDTRTEDYCRLDVPVNEKILNADGEIYGVILYLLCSIALSLSAAALYKSVEPHYCTELKVSYLNKVPSDRLSVDSRIIFNECGSAIAVADVKNNTGESLAIGHIAMMNIS